MQMTDGEVVMNIMQAKDQRGQITICADLNCCSEEKIKDILKAQGVDLRSLKGVKRHIDHGTKHKPHKEPANAKKNPANADITVAQACATLIARVAELAKQKKAIEKELEEIEAQIGRVSDDIGEALLSLPEVSE